MYKEIKEIDGDIMTVEEWKEDVANGFFIDYDGFGYPMKDNKIDERKAYVPSQINDFPKDATHIMWYNR